MSVVHRFTLAGVADTTLGVVLLPNFQEPVLPQTRDKFIEVPGRQGRWAFGSELEAREIVLELALIDSTTPETVQSLSRALAAILLDLDGNPVDVSLVFTKESTKTYTVRYSGNLPIQRLVGATKGYLSLPLIQSDPFVYGAAETTTATITAAYQEVAVTNSGDYRTPPVLTFENTGGTSVFGFTLVVRQEK
jgi:predicted phage tail component-like protein